MKNYWLLLLFSLLFSNIFAQTHTWTGNGNGYFWSDPQNWDQGTIPLVNGMGKVIIPTGMEVHSTSTINFEYGEFSGGGTLFNNGTINLINSDEVLTSKAFSNITILSATDINIYRANGVLNTDPIFLNEGALIYSGYGSGIGNFNLNSIGVSFNSLQPGVLVISSDFTKTGAEEVLIDVEMEICCYNFKVAEGTLLIEPATSNTILGPFFDIPQGSSLILKGNTIFAAGNEGAVSGNIKGLLEITDGLNENPSMTGDLFFDAEGEITLNNVTFQGTGLFHGRVNTFLPENTTVTFDGPNFSNQRIFMTGPSSTLRLKSGSKFSNSGAGEMILNEGFIEGTSNQILRNSGLISIINNSNIFVNSVRFENQDVLNIGNGNFIMDDNSEFENHHNANYEVLGKVIGSGTFKFPSYNINTVENSGMFSPQLGITTLHTENFSQTISGFIEVEINDLNSFDKIENIGSTHFEGDFNVILNFSPIIGDEFIVYQSSTPLTNCNPISTTSAEYNNLNYIFDVICNADNITLKLSEILTTNEFDLYNYDFYISPNPVTNEARFNFSTEILTSENNTIIVYNYLGQIVREIDILYKTNPTFNRMNLSNGVYFAQLLVNRKTMAITKFILY